jgi:hypothetical protein
MRNKHPSVLKGQTAFIDQGMRPELDADLDAVSSGTSEGPRLSSAYPSCLPFHSRTAPSRVSPGIGRLMK